MSDFPEGFLWGCATAAHQIEGQMPATDWRQWEQEGHINPPDSAEVANDAYRRFREDARRLAGLNQNAHRLSIEWARIEPAPGEFDPVQIEHYRQVLQAYREHGMQTMVTLHHFSSPLWFTERGGWSASGSEQAWLPFVRRVAEELGELVNFWCTINEPNVYAISGWFSGQRGDFPPGRRGDLLGCWRVLANFRRGHVAAYRELQRLTPEIPVGIAQHKWMVLPASPRWDDRLAAGIARRTLDCWPDGLRLERVIDAPSDYLGLNQYSGSLFTFDLRAFQQGF
ncbi:MAG: family 1 glycosylhydrolase, partial [Candidatus Dormibacteraceae bacterium]